MCKKVNKPLIAVFIIIDSNDSNNKTQASAR